MTITPELLTAFLIGLGTLVGAIVTAWVMSRKAPAEIAGIRAEANQDNAAASQTLASASAAWLESYNEIFKQLQLRDQDIILMNKRITELEENDKSWERKLNKERDARIAAEKERDELLIVVETMRKKIAELEAQVKELQAKSPAVKPDTQPLQPIVSQ